ncbi:hypothetical protein WDW37_15015 [Bdellovibrionota bacterium FG-1]
MATISPVLQQPFRAMVFLALALGIGVAGWVDTLHEQREQAAVVGERTLTVAKVVAAMVNPEYLRKSSLGPPDYSQRLTRLSAAICDADAGIRRIIFFRSEADQIRFLVDATGNKDPKKSQSGEIYQDAPAELRRAFQERQPKPFLLQRPGSVWSLVPVVASGGGFPVAIAAIETAALESPRGMSLLFKTDGVVVGAVVLLEFLLALLYFLSAPPRALAAPVVQADPVVLTPELPEYISPEVVSEVAVFVFSAEGQVLEVNAAALELWNFPEAVLAKKEHTAILKWMMNQMADPNGFLGQIQAKETSPLPFTVTLKDGRVLTFDSKINEAQWTLKFRKPG